MKRILLSFACVLALAGCSDDKGNNPVIDPAGSQADLAAGNTALGAGDYAAAYASYQSSLAKDPSNTQARFGVAVTGVYLVQNDPEVAELGEFFGVGPLPAAKREGQARTLSQRLGLSGAFAASPGPADMGRAFFRLMATAADDPPAISDIQRVIKLRVMPRLQAAEDHLAVIELASDFVFKLPPAVTELPDTLEIDLADVLLLDTAINGVQGWLGMLVAYDFDVPNSDFENVDAESLLAPGTEWATLHSDGAAQLSAARGNLLLVGTRLAQAAASLWAETDDQSDDLVPQAFLETAEFAELQNGVDQLTATLSGAIDVPVEDHAGAPFTLEIHLGRFFAPAILDLKTMLPNHTFDELGDPQPVVPLTFPDPTINGIFPDMTNERWQQLTGLGAPALARR